MWKNIIMAIGGISSGCSVAVAALAFVNAIGVYPRMAVKSRTVKHAVFYENIAGAGIFAGCIASLFDFSVVRWGWLLTIAGFCYGCFVGILIMGLAEVIDVFPVLFHRIRLKEGLQTVILTVAMGKLIGSLIFFILGLYK